ncbi:MAG: hypothetical protein CSA49_02630 [Gammaproteobacteria bacterium]|nr:MAG: hypothetical protein CSA49_02630 [Gammaproteobacteria bacterium]
MLPRVLDAIALIVLWVCTLLIVVAFVGIIGAVIPLGWVPFTLYSLVGLICGWMLYKRTVKPGKPVTSLLVIQCLFVMGVALGCFILGYFEWFGFARSESQIAALPVIYFILVFVRRATMTTEEPVAVKSSFFANLVLALAYLWMAAALIYLLVTTVVVFMIDLFAGVSLMLNPLNLVSWLVIFLWFLPAFLLRAFGRSMKEVKA